MTRTAVATPDPPRRGYDGGMLPCRACSSYTWPFNDYQCGVCNSPPEEDDHEFVDHGAGDA